MRCEGFSMVDYEMFAYKDARKILENKGLPAEINAVLQSIKRVNHREIQAEFYNKGWEMEHRIFPATTWACFNWLISHWPNEMSNDVFAYFTFSKRGYLGYSEGIGLSAPFFTDIAQLV